MTSQLGPGRSRVVVAMSGGVDSSVAAALLAEAGHEVIGVTLQLYDHGAAVGRKGACCAGADIHDARDVAERLGIAHYVLDFEARFEAAVIEDFASAYAEGRTPDPVRPLQPEDQVPRPAGDRARPRRRRDRHGPLCPPRRGRRRAGAASGTRSRQGPELLPVHHDRGAAGVPPLPLGELDKAATRGTRCVWASRSRTSPTARTSVSCRWPLQRRGGPPAARALQPGDIVHVDGRALGRHDGIANYTVGQRRGLKVADGERLYVVGIEPHENRVMVGPRRAGLCAEIELGEVNWLAAAGE